MEINPLTIIRKKLKEKKVEDFKKLIESLKLTLHKRMLNPDDISQIALLEPQELEAYLTSISISYKTINHIFNVADEPKFSKEQIAVLEKIVEKCKQSK